MNRLACLLLVVLAVSTLAAQETFAIRRADELRLMNASLTMPDGGKIAMWQTSQAGDPDLYAMRFGANNLPLWQQAVPLVIKPGVQSSPCLTMLSSGNILLTWMDGGLWGQAFTPDGALLWHTDGIQLLAEQDCYSLGTPVAWDDGSFGIAYLGVDTLRAKRFNASGVAVWDALCLQFNPGLDPNILQALPDNSGGMLVNISMNADPPSEFPSVTKTARLDGAGNLMVYPLFEADSFPRTYYNLFAGLAGEYYLCSTPENGTDIIYLQKANSSGQFLLPQARMLDLDCDLEITDVHLTPSIQSGIYLDWPERDDYPNVVNKVMKLNVSLEPLWTSTLGSMDAYSIYLNWQEDSSGRLWCTWVRQNLITGANNLVAQVLTASGSHAWPQDLYLHTCTRPMPFPRVAVGTNQASILYPAWDGNHTCLKQQLISADGVMLWGPGGHNIVQFPCGHGSNLAVVSLGDKFLSLWMDSRPATPGIYYQVIDHSGNIYCEELGRSLVADGNINSTYVTHCVMADGSVAILHRTGEQQTATHYLQVVNTAGNRTYPGAGIEVGTLNLNVCMVARGNAIYIYWRDGEYYIYPVSIKGQKYVDGQPQWGSEGLELINSPVSAGIVGATGQYLLWWALTGTSNNKVYATSISESGTITPGWPAASMQVLDDGTTPDQTKSYGICGEDLVVYICRGTQDITELLAQRINPSGERLWGPQGIQVCNVQFPLYVGSAVYNTEYTAFSFYEYNNPLRVGMQIMDIYGNLLLEPNGVQYDPGCYLQDRPVLGLHQDGSYSMLWTGFDATYNNSDIFLMQINADGTVAMGPIQVCAERLTQSELRYAVNGNHLLVTWNDSRHASANYIYDARSIYGYISHSSGSAADDPVQLASPPVVLMGNHPNPFGASTGISFSLKEPATLDVDIYNIRGQLVGRIANGKALQKGEHNLVWNGQDKQGNPLPSGVYLYRISADGYTTAGKMLKIR